MKKLKDISDLVFDDHNANAGTPAGLEAVERSLRKYGAGRSIVVDKNGKVIGGNKTLEKALALGLDIEVVQTSGDKLVVVQRVDIDEDDPRRYELAIADNRTSELGLSWSPDTLKFLRDNKGIDLDKFWTQEEWQDAFADFDENGAVDGMEDVEPQIDKAEELQQKWQVLNVWQNR